MGPIPSPAAPTASGPRWPDLGRFLTLRGTRDDNSIPHPADEVEGRGDEVRAVALYTGDDGGLVSARRNESGHDDA